MQMGIGFLVYNTGTYHKFIELLMHDLPRLNMSGPSGKGLMKEMGKFVEC